MKFSDSSPRLCERADRQLGESSISKITVIRNAMDEGLAKHVDSAHPRASMSRSRHEWRGFLDIEHTRTRARSPQTNGT